jgi:CRP-like cAMP-binding protein
MRMPVRRATIRNLLLTSMSDSDFDLLCPHLARVTLARDLHLVTAHQPIEYCHFIEDGVASQVSERFDGTGVEVAVIGREGITGTASLLMAEQSPHNTIVQMDYGLALRIEAGIVREAMRASPSLSALLLRYVQTLIVQTGGNAITNVADRLNVRLARWLLMCHDRVDGDDIAITHEFMATMIGAQRSAVTAALHVLEGGSLVRARRGIITVQDRPALEAAASYAYGLAEAEYRRLIAPFGKTAPPRRAEPLRRPAARH